MPFSSLLNDKISVYDEKKNLITKNQQASVQDGKLIITKNGDFVVDVGLHRLFIIVINGFLK